MSFSPRLFPGVRGDSKVQSFARLAGVYASILTGMHMCAFALGGLARCFFSFCQRLPGSGCEGSPGSVCEILWGCSGGLLECVSNWKRGVRPFEVYRSEAEEWEYEIHNSSLDLVRHISRVGAYPICHHLPGPFLHVPIATLAMPTATRHVAGWQQAANNTTHLSGAFCVN